MRGTQTLTRRLCGIRPEFCAYWNLLNALSGCGCFNCAVGMHLSIPCPTTLLRGLSVAIARRLLQICLSFHPQHRELRQLQKTIEKVKVPAFSNQVKGDLARSSGALVSLSPKAMRFLYSTTSTAELLRPLQL